MKIYYETNINVLHLKCPLDLHKSVILGNCIGYFSMLQKKITRGPS